MSFQTIESAKSADVVGNNRMALILYNPTANHTRLIAMYTAFAVWVSTSSLAKVRSMLNKLVIGVKIAELTVLMEKIFKFEPDMYIITAFIATCDPGFMAIAIAFCFLLATTAAVFCVGALEGFALLRAAFWSRDWPTIAGHLDIVM